MGVDRVIPASCSADFQVKLSEKSQGTFLDILGLNFLMILYEMLQNESSLEVLFLYNNEAVEPNELSFCKIHFS